MGLVRSLRYSVPCCIPVRGRERWYGTRADQGREEMLRAAEEQRGCDSADCTSARRDDGGSGAWGACRDFAVSLLILLPTPCTSDRNQIDRVATGVGGTSREGKVADKIRCVHCLLIGRTDCEVARHRILVVPDEVLPRLGPAPPPPLLHATSQFAHADFQSGSISGSGLRDTASASAGAGASLSRSASAALPSAIPIPVGLPISIPLPTPPTATLQAAPIPKRYAPPPEVYTASLATLFGQPGKSISVSAANRADPLGGKVDAVAIRDAKAEVVGVLDYVRLMTGVSKAGDGRIYTDQAKGELGGMLQTAYSVCKGQKRTRQYDGQEKSNKGNHYWNDEDHGDDDHDHEHDGLSHAITMYNELQGLMSRIKMSLIQAKRGQALALGGSGLGYVFVKLERAMDQWRAAVIEGHSRDGK